MCVLRAYGLNFDPRDFLRSSSLSAYRVDLRGEPRFPRSQPEGEKNKDSGFCAKVSERSWEDLPGQIEDAIEFLDRNRAELERLRSMPGLEGVSLDFPHYLRIDGENVIAQFDTLPPGLLLLAGRLDIGIELSLYPKPCNEEGSSSD